MAKIAIPEGMLAAALSRAGPDKGNFIRASVCLEASLEWLSENPIMPTEDQKRVMRGVLINIHGATEWTFIAEWQRRMFLAPEPEVPESIGDLMWDNDCIPSKEINKTILEAYRRGKMQ